MIKFPTDPTPHITSPWDDSTVGDDGSGGGTGKLWKADEKGRWKEYEPPVAGASAWSDLTDKATADLVADNGPLATSIGLLAPKANPTFTGIVTIPSGASISGYLTSATAASTYAPINTTVTLTGTQTLSNKTFPATGFVMRDDSDTFSRTVIGNDVTLGYGGQWLALGDANGAVAISTGITGLGTNVATALAIAADATGGIFRQGQALSATTVTASGAVNTGNFTSSGFIKPTYLRMGNSPNECHIYSANQNGAITIYNQAESVGTTLDVATSGLLKIRNIANNADSGIQCGNLTVSGTVKTVSYTKAAAIATSHATAIAAGDGAQAYISDDDKPVWSNGTVWKLADGTTLS